ncbi:DUF6266 family protein [Pedobacter sp. PWIIR3]
MGFLLGGPYYHLKGRTGNNVGRIVKGRNVFSMRPANSSKPPTIKQLDQRLKFGMMTAWLSWAANVIEPGFSGYDAKGSPMNAAVKYNLDNAVTGVSPNFMIDYPEVKLSRGHLAEARALSVVSDTAAEIEFTWLANIGIFNGAPTDKASFLAYCPSANLFSEVTGAVSRSALTYTMSVPEEFSGEVVHLWVSFVNPEGVSTSQYHSVTVV